MRKTIVLKSRYGDTNRLDRIGQEDSCSFLFVPKDDYYRVGYKGDTGDNDYQFVDPSGGPFISVGMYLEEADAVVKSIKGNENGGIEIEFEK